MSLSNLSAALKQRQEKIAAPVTPRRSSYIMPTNIRIGLLEKGKHAPVVRIDTGLAVMNMVIRKRIVLGAFESPEQAVLFGVSGLIRYGTITLEDILKVRSRAGFFRKFDETQIAQLLNAKRLVYNVNRTNHEVSIFSIEDNGFECEIESPDPNRLTIATGRKFR